MNTAITIISGIIAILIYNVVDRVLTYKENIAKGKDKDND